MRSANWAGAPTSGLWNDGPNWSTGVVPSDTAQFAASSVTAISFAPGSAATIGAIGFLPGAPSFTFTITELNLLPSLTITGAGVSNASQARQSFLVTSLGTYNQPQLKFTGTATAGEDGVSYYAGPPSLDSSYGGGTIMFHDKATAGAASFTVRTGKQAPPNRQSTLGGQIVFHDSAGAGRASFSIYGTLGTDGDTFANAVFHDTASAQTATFVNHGGTVPAGDGGNTQFYDTSTAATGNYLNHGGKAFDAKLGGANGGDVAFDGLATGGQGRFNNYPAAIAGANGGVTSFNNNPNYPTLPHEGASAGQGTYLNFGANATLPGGGGHTEFTARYGFATADHGTFVNFGSDMPEPSSAGHTIFSISPPTSFFPTAANGTFWNLPGVAGGYTVFQIYGKTAPTTAPTAASGTFHNLGGTAQGQVGGYTTFQGTATAGTATLIAHGGSNGGAGGRILFSDAATGGSANLCLTGNGVLDLTQHSGGLTIGALDLSQGVIRMTLCQGPMGLGVVGNLTLRAAGTGFDLALPDGTGVVPGQVYTLLTAPGLGLIAASQFQANAIGLAMPLLRMVGNSLTVSYVMTP